MTDATRTSSSPFIFSETSLENVFIGIAGLIGAGKTTLATALSKELNLPVFYEPVQDNEYLQDFYGDIGKYSFQMQVYLLNRRFQQHQQVIWQGKGGVQDRTIYEDSVFAKMLHDSGLMDSRDYETYISLFKNMSNFMKKPNVIVYLDVSAEESMERIRMRNRGCESGITFEYMSSLRDAYEEFIMDISRVIPVIRVNYSEFRTAEEMAVVIAREYRQISAIRTVGAADFTRLREANRSPSPTSSPAASPLKAPEDEASAAAVEQAEEALAQLKVRGDEAARSIAAHVADTVR